MTGDFPRALSNLERAAALYKPEEHRRLALQFGQDIEAQCLQLFVIGPVARWISRSGEPCRV